jgi:hypothetical protein
VSERLTWIVTFVGLVLLLLLIGYVISALQLVFR